MNILNKSDYFKRHLELCAIHRTGKDAYEALEIEFEEAFKLKGRERIFKEFKGYSTYEAFRNGKSDFFRIKANR